MEEKDFQRIKQMVSEVVDAKLEQMSVKVDAKLEQHSVSFDSKLEQLSVSFDSKLEQLSVSFDSKFDSKLEQLASTFDSRFDQHKQEIVEQFQHHLSLQTEYFQKGVTVVAEGHKMLAEKIDRMETRLETKIVALAKGLDAHRTDPEAHRGGAYRVMEE